MSRSAPSHQARQPFSMTGMWWWAAAGSRSENVKSVIVLRVVRLLHALAIHLVLGFPLPLERFLHGLFLSLAGFARFRVLPVSRITRPGPGRNTEVGTADCKSKNDNESFHGSPTKDHFDDSTLVRPPLIRYRCTQPQLEVERDTLLMIS